MSSVTPAIAQSDKSSKDESFAVRNTQNPKNVIFLVGDGMGPSFNTAYRYYKNDPHAKEMTPTAFDSYLKGTRIVHIQMTQNRILLILQLAEQPLVSGHKEHIMVPSVLTVTSRK
ncbi:alkaline phosphatase [Staphylococcus aureus]